MNFEMKCESVLVTKKVKILKIELVFTNVNLLVHPAAQECKALTPS